jgi:hypothetical protein
MCATSTINDIKTVEILNPPQGSKIGELINLEGYSSVPAEAKVLKKKKVIVDSYVSIFAPWRCVHRTCFLLWAVDACPYF